MNRKHPQQHDTWGFDPQQWLETPLAVTTYKPIRTKLIYLWGGPGSGKSTLAADVFQYAKRQGKSIELVREYAKDLVWAGQSLNQIVLWGEQSHREKVLLNKVDYLVTDSPWPMGMAYAKYYGSVEPEVVAAMLAVAKKERRSAEYVDIFVRRSKPYVTAGRNETETQAREIDEMLRATMLSLSGSGELIADSNTPSSLIWQMLEKGYGW